MLKLKLFPFLLLLAAQVARADLEPVLTRTATATGTGIVSAYVRYGSILLFASTGCGPCDINVSASADAEGSFTDYITIWADEPTGFLNWQYTASDGGLATLSYSLPGTFTSGIPSAISASGGAWADWPAPPGCCGSGGVDFSINDLNVSTTDGPLSHFYWESASGDPTVQFSHGTWGEPPQVPEPSTLALFALVALVAAVRMRHFTAPSFR
jgi:hypothetical protein